MHSSKLPLTVWFWAAYLMATHSNGISALQLQRLLALGSYKSAWLLCAKLRRAMVAPARALLAGIAEIDETEIPLRAKDDPIRGGGGRSSQSKMLVAGAVEVADGAPGRIRLATIQDFSAASLHGFVAANLAQGATIKTDGWAAYPGAPNVAHDPHVVGNMAAHIVLPWIHRVFSNLKTWALGVYHGLRRKHPCLSGCHPQPLAVVRPCSWTFTSVAIFGSTIAAEFQRLFPDDAACAGYLEKARWSDGFVCPHCQAAGEPFRFANRPGVLRCRRCRRDTPLSSASTGGSSTPSVPCSASRATSPHRPTQSFTPEPGSTYMLGVWVITG